MSRKSVSTEKASPILPPARSAAESGRQNRTPCPDRCGCAGSSHHEHNVSALYPGGVGRQPHFSASHNTLARSVYLFCRLAGEMTLRGIAAASCQCDRTRCSRCCHEVQAFTALTVEAPSELKSPRSPWAAPASRLAGSTVAVGGSGVAVGGSDVAVGGSGVAVGGSGVAVGGSGVAVGGSGVAVGGSGVAVGGSAVAVGGSAVAVGGSDVAVGGSAVAVGDSGSVVAVGSPPAAATPR